ncbi:hypothetical protein FD755_002187 [Muntiacus reevesi]|uniref:Nuclear nucleic acid-binding protein C1D n=2 Tax=Muntiacus TaxID=9885 RepID=A0A5J5N3H2_MUNRE|nr:hypothetical protein FD754_007147 [Muntiacus muntjak]KAB0387231.1 hypothetical protein FD755_002187 [Muntiacus reevesi]
MAGEEINEDYSVEIHEYLSTFENSIGGVDEMLKTKMSSLAYILNSMFGVYLATCGVSPKEHPKKQELERIRVYMNRVKEITGKKKTSELDSGAALRFVKKYPLGSKT